MRYAYSSCGVVFAFLNGLQFAGIGTLASTAPEALVIGTTAVRGTMGFSEVRLYERT